MSCLVGYDGGYTAIGNGNICAYLRRGEMASIFGPPYSSPSALTLEYEGEAVVRSPASVVENTGIHITEIETEDKKEAFSTDFACFDGTPCIVKRVQCAGTFHMRLAICPDIWGAKVTENTARFDGASYAVLIHIPAGNDIYNKGMYPMRTPLFYQVLLYGCASARVADGGLPITFGRGLSHLVIIGGASYRDCVLNTEHILAEGVGSLLEKAREGWCGFFRQLDVEGRFDKDAYRRGDVVKAIKRALVNIMAQTSSDGGVLAGPNYHLGYIRDQYGVFRAYLALGMYDYARRIIDFYHDNFTAYGYLTNAMGLGVRGLFHRAENDEVEITSYVVLHAFDYLHATGDHSYMAKLFPMLLWCLREQLPYLSDGMLPFNCDETYFGFLPRTAAGNGASEGTALFVKVCELMLDYIKSHPSVCQDEGLVASINEKFSGARERFRENFFQNGLQIANQPGRKALQKRFVVGVCSCCRAYFGEVELTDTGVYACLECRMAGKYKNVFPCDTVYRLQSPALMPYYIGSGLVSRDDLAAAVENAVTEIKRSGDVPTLPGSVRKIGYDYGLLLYASHMLGGKDDRLLIDLILSVRDECSMWSEYYDLSSPAGTCCRPWESGINISALLYALANGKGVE